MKQVVRASDASRSALMKGPWLSPTYSKKVAGGLHMIEVWAFRLFHQSFEIAAAYP